MIAPVMNGAPITMPDATSRAELDRPDAKGAADACSRSMIDATRLTAADVALLVALLQGRVGDAGRRELAAELGIGPGTLDRALRRRPMRAATIAKLRTEIAARAHEPSPVMLAPDERALISTLIRSVGGHATIARLLLVAPSTLLRATNGGRARRATIVRIRAGLSRLEKVPR